VSYDPIDEVRIHTKARYHFGDWQGPIKTYVTHIFPNSASVQSTCNDMALWETACASLNLLRDEVIPGRDFSNSIPSLCFANDNIRTHFSRSCDVLDCISV
jgi:hypothetical protein